MTIPQIQIRQTPARLSIDADPGRLEMKQPKATFELKTIPGRLQIESGPGQLIIDNSAWHDALGVGNHLESMSRIYSTCKQIALEGIANRVAQGNRMAAIHTGENVIASLARESTKDVDNYQFMYMGPASFDNIDIRYEPTEVNIQVEEARVQKNIEMNPADIQYHLGKRDIYMAQYPKVEIIPPNMDIKI
ncbi:DUF6470 family protein [Paenibacillus silviterrae]|uniref:DUF6470 family protein n=1 Tax=Paenibacillus silviterrae TaxID=3242194 RepID=UPI0025435EA1|nr:DUF6470 family protein [Paenibacillus chinjuensis]